MKMIQASLDHSAVGCGQRRCFVLSEGRKWTTRLDPTQLTRFRVKPDALHRSQEVSVDRRFYRKTIKARVNNFSRWGKRFPRMVVKQLIEELSA